MGHSDFYPNCGKTIKFFLSQSQAICSNKPEDLVRKIPERLDCLHPFKFIGGGAFKTRKSDPEDIDHLLARRDPSLHQCADGEHNSALDIKTGKNANVRT